MNAPGDRHLTAEQTEVIVTTASDGFALSYQRLDPESLRLLTEAVEAKARRMRAEALRDLLKQFGRFVYRSVAGLAAPAQALTRRVRLSA